MSLLSASCAQASDEMFEHVIARAQALADSAHAPVGRPLPAALQELSYDAYRQIRFDPDKAYWKDDSPFSLQLFHSGFLFQEPVAINLVEDGEATLLRFDSDDYIYEGAAQALPERDLDGSGHAGFRLHYPLNSAGYHDEAAVFLGASYFRLVGRDQVYGLSTRGLALNTTSPDGEEFPAFREFWLFKPEQGASSITLLALMDSPSLSGAYRITLTPGERTEAEVEATLFARTDIDTLGVAPLTSMFSYGEASAKPPEDFRPQVHDSDGLLVHTGGDEWIWRPLTNPQEKRVSTFVDDQPQGFGLMQRERDFDRYLDMEAKYHRRPSQWVEPIAPWGAGRVELIEIPTPDETHDNIVAYWVFDAPLEAGDSRAFHYRTFTLNGETESSDLARAFRTRHGRVGINDDTFEAEAFRQFGVNFEGGELEHLAPEQKIDLVIDSADEVLEPHLLPLPDNRWRASFRIPTGTLSDIRLYLALDDTPISEIWNYVWSPDA